VCELKLGVQTYAAFGPVILFGIGGALSKALEDQAVSLPPLNRLLARRLMEKTQAYRLLTSLASTTQDIITLLAEHEHAGPGRPLPHDPNPCGRKQRV